MQSSRKDQAALLLDAIRNISKSKQEGGTIKETSRAQLERELQECDIRLTEFVSDHYEDLGNVMNIFELIAQRIRDSKLKIRRIRDNLQNCKRLLQYKRDELRGGWIQAVEQRNIASLLDRISSVKNSLDKVDGYVAEKYFLHAAEQLASAKFQFKSELSRIEPLKSLGVEIDAKVEHLYQTLLDELNTQIYIRSPSSAVQMFHRHMSSRRSSSRRFNFRDSRGKANKVATPRHSSTEHQQITKHFLGERVSQSSDESHLNNPKLSLWALFVKIPQMPRPLHEDTTSGSNPESDHIRFMAVILESLSVLGLLRRATDFLQVNLRSELSGIAKRATQQILDNMDDDVSDIEQSNRKTANGDSGIHSSQMSAWSAFVNPLALAYQSTDLLTMTDRRRQSLRDLFDLIFSQFKCVLAVHRLISELLEQARQSPTGVDCGPYSLSVVWSVMDGYLSEMVELYSNDNQDESRSNFLGDDKEFATLVFAKDVNSSSVDIGPFFTRRKQPPQMSSLFRFTNSAQAQTMDIYMREVRQQQYGADSTNAPSADKRPMMMSDMSAACENWQNHLVCRPEVFNIAPLYAMMNDFVGEVTEVLDPDVPKNEAVNSSTVMVLMHNIIAKKFINGLDSAVEKFLSDVPRMLDGMRLMRIPDSLVEVHPQGVGELVRPHGTQLARHHLHSTKTMLHQDPVDTTIKYCLVPFVASRLQLGNMVQLIRALPDFADPLAGLCERCFSCLSSHSKASYERLARYRGSDAQQQYSSNPLTRAALTASDPDISRTFKTNAVWYEMERNLKNNEHLEKQEGCEDGLNLDQSDMIVTRDDIVSDLTREVDMIVQEIRNEAPNLRTEALLMRLCIGGASCRSSLATDSLAGLARLGDSLYWFVAQLTEYVQKFNVSEDEKQRSNSQKNVPTTRFAKLSTVLMGVANEMKDLADTCFLTLHLDTLYRCAAFLSTGPLNQHLGAVSSANPGSAESDELVHKIESELSLLENVLCGSSGNAESVSFDEDPTSARFVGLPFGGGGLSRSKMRYIFAGVSRLAAVLLVRYGSTRVNQLSGEPFNESMINKIVRTIVALQAAFSRVSGCNQADLDYARRYYELLYLTPSDLIQRIVSGGATQFTEREYDILLKLMEHSPQHRQIPPEDFKNFREQVRDLIVAKNKIMLQQKRNQDRIQQSAANVRQQQSRSSTRSAKLHETKPATKL